VLDLVNDLAVLATRESIIRETSLFIPHANLSCHSLFNFQEKTWHHWWRSQWFSSPR